MRTRGGSVCICSLSLASLVALLQRRQAGSQQLQKASGHIMHYCVATMAVEATLPIIQGVPSQAPHSIVHTCCSQDAVTIHLGMSHKSSLLSRCHDCDSATFHEWQQFTAKVPKLHQSGSRAAYGACVLACRLGSLFLLVNKQTDRWDGQTDRQTDRQTGRQTDRLPGWGAVTYATHCCLAKYKPNWQFTAHAEPACCCCNCCPASMHGGGETMLQREVVLIIYSCIHTAAYIQLHSSSYCSHTTIGCLYTP